MPKRHAGLDRAFDLSWWAYFLDFILVPIAVGGLVWFGIRKSVPPAFVVIWIADGIFFWMLAEYWIHRAIFHGPTRFEPMHDMHHRMPKDWIGIASWGTFLGFGVIFGCARLYGLEQAALFTAGFMIGYFWYCAIHVRMHHGRTHRHHGYVAFMTRHHDGHHRGGKGNYGVTTPIFDFLFDTYRPSK